MTRTESLIAELARTTCEEAIPVGFEDSLAEQPAPVPTPVVDELDPEIPF